VPGRRGVGGTDGGIGQPAGTASDGLDEAILSLEEFRLVGQRFGGGGDDATGGSHGGGGGTGQSILHHGGQALPEGQKELIGILPAEAHRRL